MGYHKMKASDVEVKNEDNIGMRCTCGIIGGSIHVNDSNFDCA